MKPITAFQAISLVTMVSLTLLACGPRIVTVNGQRMTPQQIAALDQAHCGGIPNGNFWIDFDTGLWGRAGDPNPIGRFDDLCRIMAQLNQLNAFAASLAQFSQSLNQMNQSATPAYQRRKSLSERGMLFSTSDFLR